MAPISGEAAARELGQHEYRVFIRVRALSAETDASWMLIDFSELARSRTDARRSDAGGETPHCSRHLTTEGPHRTCAHVRDESCLRRKKRARRRRRRGFPSARAARVDPRTGTHFQRCHRKVTARHGYLQPTLIWARAVTLRKPYQQLPQRRLTPARCRSSQPLLLREARCTRAGPQTRRCRSSS